jgi:sterol desaturase/sphingolipid hydroxylase (fatty acid hydroxylase superfamily)
MEAILANEVPIRIGCFAGLLVLLALFEALLPRRAQKIARSRRWPANLGIALVNTIVVRVLFPITAVGAALAFEARGGGLINLAAIPDWLAVVLGFLVLDLAIYGQHIVFHKLPLLWRLHRMHHADLDVDVTTGLRFHPFEILISLAIKIAVVIALGVPAVAVLVFEVVLNAISMFNHANAAMPRWLDRLIRLVVVTPDMHRVHHSVKRHETDSNFGFNLPWWDRLFRTYRAEPEAGHAGMTVGLPILRDPRELRLGRLLTQPFRDEPGPH